MDVTDLSHFPDRSFDGVVCYGGPISYVFDRADDAVEEMLRVTRPGGYVLLSVMSLTGATRRFLGAVHDIYQKVGLEAIQEVVDTGDQYGAIAPKRPSLPHVPLGGSEGSLRAAPLQNRCRLGR